MLVAAALLAEHNSDYRKLSCSLPFPSAPKAGRGPGTKSGPSPCFASRDLASRLASVTPERLVAPEGLIAPERLVTPERLVAPQRLIAPEGLITPEGLIAPERLVAPEGLVRAQ